MYKIKNPYKTSHLLDLHLMEAQQYRQNKIPLSALVFVSVPLGYFLVCLTFVANSGF